MVKKSSGKTSRKNSSLTLTEFLLKEIGKSRKSPISRSQLIKKCKEIRKKSTERSVYNCLKRLVDENLVIGRSPRGGTRGGYYHFCLKKDNLKIVYSLEYLKGGYKQKVKLVPT